MRKSKQAKAKEFSKEEKLKIRERDDSLCIFCLSNRQLTYAHYISRGSQGLGIEENGALVCMSCHYKMDHTTQRDYYLMLFRRYLDYFYPNFKNEDRIYKKGVEY